MTIACILPDKDCCIEQFKPNAALNGVGLWVDMLYAGGGKTQNFRTLMHLTIPAEVNVAEIYKAYLYLFQGWGFANATALWEICHITQPAWTELATWNKYDGTNAWASPGGDFNQTAPEPYKTETINPNPWSTWRMVDITELVTYAITNHARSLDLLIKLQVESLGYSIQTTFYSKDQLYATDYYRRPFLCIVRPPFGRPREV